MTENRSWLSTRGMCPDSADSRLLPLASSVVLIISVRQILNRMIPPPLAHCECFQNNCQVFFNQLRYSVYYPPQPLSSLCSLALSTASGFGWFVDDRSHGEMWHSSPMTTSIQNSRLRLLNALRAGSKPILTFLGLPSFRTAQIVAQTGIDVSRSHPLLLIISPLTIVKGIIIDCEHGHISDDSMHSSTAAIAALGVSPLVRLRMTHSDLIKRALDAGAQ